MTQDQIQKIVEAMSGMTYLEWNKLSDTIEQCFRIEARDKQNKIEITSPERIVAEYDRLF